MLKAELVRVEKDLPESHRDNLTGAGTLIRHGQATYLRRLVMPWQIRAFGYFDLVGEFKFAAQFYARALSQLELFAAEKDENGDLVRTENEQVIEAFERIKDPGGIGRSGLQRAYGLLAFLVGEAILFVSINPETGEEQWEMLSTDEIRLLDGNYTRFKAPVLPATLFRPAPDDAFVPVGMEKDPKTGELTGEYDQTAVAYRLHRPHPRFCADESTEILTPDGWRSHDDLRPAQLVLTLNHETGESEWQPVAAVNRFEVEDEEMVSIEGLGHSSLTTPEHRWPVMHCHRERGEANWLEREWTTSERLNSNDRIVTAAPCADLPTEKVFSDEFVEAVAWFYTEGNIARRHVSAQVSLCQSDAANPVNVVRMRESLTALFGDATTERMSTGSGTLAPPKWREYREPNRDTVYFWLNTAASEEILAVAPDKVVSCDFVRALTCEQLELFIEVSTLADGHVTKNGVPILAQKDERRLEAFALACILVGRTPRWRKNAHVFETKRERYRMKSVRASHKRTCHITASGQRESKGAYPERHHYTGTVWCPTTRNGTWLARRNGTVYFTGNSALPDSTTEGVLDILEELVLLTQVIRARLRSRLWTAGFLFIDDRITTRPDEPAPDEDVLEDPLMEDLTEAITTAIADEGTAAAVAPILLRVRVPDGMKLADLVYHMQIQDPLQIYPEAGLRNEAIRRLAISLDMPVEALLGFTDTNHWNAWIIDDQIWQAHIQPVADGFVEDLTSAYLGPYLREELSMSDWKNYVIAYDATKVINHPDRTKIAIQLHDKAVIGDEALRRETAFGDDDAPTKEESARIVGIATRDSSLAWLGVPSVRSGGVETAPGVISTGHNEQPGGPATGAEAETGPPPGGQSPGTDTTVGAATIEGAAVYAQLRAREAAGARLRQLARRDEDAMAVIDGAPNGLVAPKLGRTRVRRLLGGAGEAELVAATHEIILAALLELGVRDPAVAESIAETIERHAARTLYDERPDPLPPTFGAKVEGLLAASKKGG